MQFRGVGINAQDGALNMHTHSPHLGTYLHTLAFDILLAVVSSFHIVHILCHLLHSTSVPLAASAPLAAFHIPFHPLPHSTSVPLAAFHIPPWQAGKGSGRDVCRASRKPKVYMYICMHTLFTLYEPLHYILACNPGMQVWARTWDVSRAFHKTQVASV